MSPLWLLAALVVFGWTLTWLGVRLLARSGAGSLRCQALLALGLGATPVLVLNVYVRVASLALPHELTQTPGWTVVDSSGVVLQRDTSDGLRIPVPLDEVAPIMVEATIAAEDARFRDHPGVDPFAIGRALASLPFQRSGASTLTQQLARHLYIAPSTPQLERKLREALLALQLEARYSKDEILSLYLNEVYYGRGAYGVEAAARVYFGVGANNLNLAQAAYLAGLPQRPAHFGQDVHSSPVRARQRYVLRRLTETGKVAASDAYAAASTPLLLLPEQAPVLAPHFVSHVLEELTRLRPELAGRPGLVIETTLDAGLQSQAQQQAGSQVALLEKKGAGNAAVVVLEPPTGRVLAMVGSADFDDEERDGQINMTLAPRQPGSALKPFLYGAAFERGFTAASMLLDVPTSFESAGRVYHPLNYDRRFHGPVSLRVALASSLNVPAVRTLDVVSVEAMLEVAHRFGLGTLTDAEVYDLALALGGGEVTLLDLTNAYAALANGGLLQTPYVIERVRDHQGTIVYEHKDSPSRRVISPEHAFLLADILSDGDARELGFGYAPALRLPFPAAVKTGTTTEFRDNWTLGFTSQRAVGVWVGNADNTPMRNVSGIDGAAPIWRGVLEASMRGLVTAWPAAPAGLQRVEVCLPAGLLPGPACPTIAEEWFVAGSEPQAVETYYSIDAQGRLLVNPPDEARAWSAAAGMLLSNDVREGAEAFVLQPAPGSVLFYAPELHKQSVLLQASPPPGAKTVEFWVDGVLVAAVQPGQASAVWTLTLGKHVLEVRAMHDGSLVSQAISHFEVRR